MILKPQEELINLQPRHRFFIGIDSDGSVFDTMELKQKECFCPNVIKFFELQTISKYARETWEFVNLYSKSRGCNRFIGIDIFFELMSKRKDVLNRNPQLPDITPLREWIKMEKKLGMPALEKYARKVHNPVIELVLRWSKKVNSDIEEMVYGMRPFPNVRKTLQKINSLADSMVVSQTPIEALVREWKENKIHDLVDVIAGQEHGTKTEHIAMAAANKYPADNMLVIGDSLGDKHAAKSNGAHFYPINPGQEDASWERLYHESLDRFFAGTYAGDYEGKLIALFESLLPDKPSWEEIAIS